MRAGVLDPARLPEEPVALLGATAGQGVVWYTGQFYARFFLTITLKLDYQSAYLLIAISLIIGTPFFIFFGWLSDKIGRKKIIMVGCLLAICTYFPLFKALTHYANPALERARQMLEASISGTNVDMLKQSEQARTTLKSKVDNILQQFEW